MSTPFLRDWPWHLAHVFYMSIPKPDLRGFSFFSFRRIYLVKGSPIFPNNLDWRKKHVKQTETKVQVFVWAHKKSCAKFRGLDSKRRRGFWPGNEFPSFIWNQPVSNHCNLLVLQRCTSFFMIFLAFFVFPLPSPRFSAGRCGVVVVVVVVVLVLFLLSHELH